MTGEFPYKVPELWWLFWLLTWTSIKRSSSLRRFDSRMILLSLQWSHNERDGVSIACSIVCSSADQRKHQSSVSLAFVRRNHRWRWIPFTKRKCNVQNVSIWWRHHRNETYVQSVRNVASRATKGSDSSVKVLGSMPPWQADICWKHWSGWKFGSPFPPEIGPMMVGRGLTPGVTYVTEKNLMLEAAQSFNSEICTVKPVQWNLYK